MAVKTKTSAFEGERVAKVIARCGYCSKREAEKLIAEGRVKVNGKVIDSPALNITDHSIKIDNKLLQQKQPTRLWIMHKPAGTVVSTAQEGHIPTIFSMLPKNMPRVVSVGRLDVNTEGLLLLTNNGELANFIGHPSTGWTRQYRARVFGYFNRGKFEMLAKRGVVIKGIRYEPIRVTIEKDAEKSNYWIKISLKEGKNREVRKVLEHYGLQVSRLIRMSFGPFNLGSLPLGRVKEVPKRSLVAAIGNKVDLK